ncbi:MAG: hypothetical protein ACLFOY_03130 [Desulfatibacillaceae bacterium]
MAKSAASAPTPQADWKRYQQKARELKAAGDPRWETVARKARELKAAAEGGAGSVKSTGKAPSGDAPAPVANWRAYLKKARELKAVDDPRWEIAARKARELKAAAEGGAGSVKSTGKAPSGDAPAPVANWRVYLKKARELKAAGDPRWEAFARKAKQLKASGAESRPVPVSGEPVSGDAAPAWRDQLTRARELKAAGDPGWQAEAGKAREMKNAAGQTPAGSDEAVNDPEALRRAREDAEATEAARRAMSGPDLEALATDSGLGRGKRKRKIPKGPIGWAVRFVLLFNRAAQAVYLKLTAPLVVLRDNIQDWRKARAEKRFQRELALEPVRKEKLRRKMEKKLAKEPMRQKRREQMKRLRGFLFGFIPLFNKMVDRMVQGVKEPLDSYSRNKEARAAAKKEAREQQALSMQEKEREKNREKVRRRMEKRVRKFERKKRRKETMRRILAPIRAANEKFADFWAYTVRIRRIIYLLALIGLAIYHREWVMAKMQEYTSIRLADLVK